MKGEIGGGHCGLISTPFQSVRVRALRGGVGVGYTGCISLEKGNICFGSRGEKISDTLLEHPIYSRNKFWEKIN